MGDPHRFRDNPSNGGCGGGHNQQCRIGPNHKNHNNNNNRGSDGGGGRRCTNQQCHRGLYNNNAYEQEQQQAPPPPRSIEEVTAEDDCDDSASFTHYQRAPVHRDETEERLTLALDVPAGFASDDINVSMEGDFHLCIEGSRTNCVGNTFYIQERFYLDEDTYNFDTIQGNLSDGVLEIMIQKKPSLLQPRRVISVTTNKKFN
jgi:HSP20 family molecular chaperone IbpA